jgi:1,2-phenylacetyl-CoA epoxidase catalytic subunit
MKNEKQTAVEWLFDRFNMLFMFHEGIPNELQKAYEQAKEMEKQRIETAYNKGTVHGIDYPESTLPLTGEQYYEQTYGGGEQ